MSRYLLLAADGETILATLSMSEEDARLNVGSGQALIELVVDSGHVLDDGTVKYSPTDGIVMRTDDSVVEALAGLEMVALP